MPPARKCPFCLSLPLRPPPHRITRSLGPASLLNDLARCGATLAPTSAIRNLPHERPRAARCHACAGPRGAQVRAHLVCGAAGAVLGHLEGALRARNPQPATWNRNPQPATGNIVPATRNPQPGSRDMEPATTNPEFLISFYIFPSFTFRFPLPSSPCLPKLLPPSPTCLCPLPPACVHAHPCSGGQPIRRPQHPRQDRLFVRRGAARNARHPIRRRGVFASSFNHAFI